MTKKAKYEPTGDEISVEVAYMQAATILDVAAAFAIEERSLEGLQTLAVLWMELGERLMNGPDDEEGENGSEPVILGFGNGGMRDNERVD